MFLLLKPDARHVTTFLEDRRNDSFSYPHVGMSATESPDGYVTDHNRIRLGTGGECFERAKTAVRGWKMFDMSWVELIRPDTPIEAGRDVAVLIHHLGFYSLNAARIVYVIDQPDRFGFAYGTLTEHGESGEERFSVEFNPKTGEVWYDLFAFSRPNHFLAKLGYPLARRLQKRFAADSKAAMVWSCQNREQ